MVFALLFTSTLSAADDGKHWGIEADGGVAIIPNSLISAPQDRYTASLSSYTYSAGLVRFHGNGAPSYSLDFSGTKIDGTAADKTSNGTYNGNAQINGFLARKFVTFVARPRFNIGMGFGAGVAPQLKSNYTLTLPVGNTTQVENKQWVLKEIPVTPLFDVEFRGDIRVSKNFSIGPWGGIRNGLPAVGGVVRVHFVK